MDGAWIGAISALSGVAVSGIISSWRSRSEFRRDKSWTLHLERRAHIEELYQIVEEISETYGRMYVEAVLYKKATTDSLAEHARTLPIPRMKMLLDLYVPDLGPDLEPIERRALELGAAIGATVQPPLASVMSQDRVRQKLNESRGEFVDAIEQAQQRIVEESIRIRNETTSRTDKWLAPRTRRQRLAARLKRWPWTSD